MKTPDRSDVWIGKTPEGFAYEIKHWGKGTICNGKGMWNYYITIPEMQVTPEMFKKLWLEPESFRRDIPLYNYFDTIFASAHWHGGVTYYEKKIQADSNHRSVKIGCDYGHLWDEECNYDYDINDVLYDVMNTSKDLAQLLAPINIWCSWSGFWFESKFDMGNNERYQNTISPSGMGDRSGYMRKRRNEMLEELGLAHLVV